MGHDEHFLRRLDRVADNHVELALTLYRDQELLGEVLSRASLRPGDERLAISLEDPIEGPFVIVTRTGRFVTCLGHGMRIGEHAGVALLTRERLDAAAAKVERMRERLAEARRLSEEGAEMTAGRIFARMRDHGLAVAREDAETLIRFQPLLARTAIRILTQAGMQIRGLRRTVGAMRFHKLRGRDEEILEAFGRATSYLAHFMVLTDHAEIDRILGKRDEDAVDVDPWWIFAATGFDLGTCALAVRGLWTLARHARATLPAVKGAEGDPRLTIAMMRELSLGVIALASSRARAEALKALTTEHRVPENHGESVHEMVAAIAHAVRQTVEAPEDALTFHHRFGEMMVARLKRRLEDPSCDPSTDPTDEQLAAIPEPAARAFFANVDISYLGEGMTIAHVVSMLPWIARARPEELYLPRELLHVLPEHSIANVIHFAQPFSETAMLTRPPTAVRKQPKAGRNDPCPCGSGKKYKKCCGAQ